MKRKVTKELVFEACRRLRDEGVDVSSRNVLNEIGGSMSTIIEHLREWNLQEQQAARAKMNISDAFLAALHAENERLISMAIAEKKTELKALRGENEDLLNSLKNEETKNNAIEEEYLNLKKELDEVLQQAANERAQKLELAQQNEMLRDKVEALVMQISKKDIEIATLRAEAGSLQREIQSYKEKIHHLEDKTNSLQKSTARLVEKVIAAESRERLLESMSNVEQRVKQPEQKQLAEISDEEAAAMADTYLQRDTLKGMAS